jgi:hypothetical protein
MQPKDAVEKMLIQQIALTHARVIKLSARSLIQKNERWYRTISESYDRAVNTFRRLALTLKQYRETPKAKITAVQTNIANQQIVQQQVIAGTAPSAISAPKSNELSETTPRTELAAAPTAVSDIMVTDGMQKNMVASGEGSSSSDAARCSLSERVKARAAGQGGRVVALRRESSRK